MQAQPDPDQRESRFRLAPLLKTCAVVTRRAMPIASCVVADDEVLNRDLLANMCHGGKIAMLGIPEANTQIDWSLVVFNSLTIQGIYGREMYETWYKMTVMLQSGLDISPMITHRFGYAEFEKAFEVARSGLAGKVIMNWLEDA